jgi:hypothetical protein
MATKSKEIIGRYDLPNGAIVSIQEGEAIDYASMRARQLSALTHVMGGEGFELWNEEIQSNVKWLASTLSGELASLISIIDADARANKNARRKGSK